MTYTNKKRFIFMFFLLNWVDMSWGSCDKDVPSRRVPTRWISSIAMFRDCSAGTYRDLGEDRCSPCPDGFFMTETMAAGGLYAFCEKCYEASSNELVVKNCTKTRDTHVHCQAGYYRRHDPERAHCKCCWECAPCDVCGGGDTDRTYEKQSCHAHNNRVCCPNQDMVVKDNRCVHFNNTHSTHLRRNEMVLVIKQHLIEDNNSCRSYQSNSMLLVICCVMFNVLDLFRL